MIDIHCHILPGIDDGPRTLDDALALARALVSDGVTTVVATPHVYPGVWNNRRSTIAQAYAGFQEQLRQSGIPLSLLWGGEVRMSFEVIEWLAQGELPYLGANAPQRSLLIELPDAQVPVGTEAFIAHLAKAGVVPLVAHPERNKAIMARPERLLPLRQSGAWVQVTAGSLVGQFGARAQDVARELLERGWVDVVASDAHNLGGRRPRMADAQAWLAREAGPAVARRLTWDTPGALCGALTAPA